MLPPLFTADYLSRLETLRIQTRRRFLGSRPGGHLSLRRGAGLEFADYRRYSPGDDLRYIDWNLYGRTDRLYIKQFQEEEELYTSLFLDSSASMAYPAQDGKSEAARDIILSLAHVVLAGSDAVKLSLLGAATPQSAPATTPFFRGRQRLVNFAEFLAGYIRSVGFQPANNRDHVNVVQSLARQLQQSHHPGKAVWVSDFLFPLPDVRAGLSLLRGAGFDLAVIQILGHEEIDPPTFPGGARLTDSESGEESLVYFDDHAKQTYMQRLDRHNRELQSSCHQAGVHYARFITHQDLPYFVLRELPELGLLM